MKKLIVVAMIVGVGGWFAWAKVLRPAPKRACDRLADLCGNSAPRDSDDNSCSEFFDALATQGGEKDTNKTALCVLDAKTCPEALGCTTGGAVRLGTGVAKGFLDGFQKSVK